MYVIVGEKGDTDHEELVSGSHKTVIMKGIVDKGSEELLRTAGSYQREDIVPEDSPLIVYTKDGIRSGEIMSALKAASKATSGLWFLGDWLFGSVLFYFCSYPKMPKRRKLCNITILHVVDLIVHDEMYVILGVQIFYTKSILYQLPWVPITLYVQN